MKTLTVILALVLATTLGWGQSHTIKPPISTTAIDSNVVTSGSTTIYNVQLRRPIVDSVITYVGNDTLFSQGTSTFNLVEAGATITSDSGNLPVGVTVLTKVSADTLIMSDTATASSDSLDVLNFVNPGAYYTNVVVGQRIQGAGIPLGTTVVTKTNDTSLVISNAATATDTLQDVRFNYFTSLAYAAGDAMGFPVTVPPFRKLKQVILIDDAKQITSADLVFFGSAFTETADNVAFAPSDADAENIIGYLTVGGTGANKALGNNTLMVLPFTTLGPEFSQGGTMYCQLVAVGTPTFTAVDNLTLKFIFE